jgi:hypothetical protein
MSPGKFQYNGEFLFLILLKAKFFPVLTVTEERRKNK